jgi:transcriptional regulator
MQDSALKYFRGDWYLSVLSRFHAPLNQDRLWVCEILLNWFLFANVLYYETRLRILGMGRKPQKNDSLPGSLDMVILQALTRGKLHGYAIVQRIRQRSGDEILIEEGSLYPALQRLELNGWIDGEWGLTSANRRARIYQLTASGRKQLTREKQRYKQLTLAIQRVMGMG